MYVKAFTHFNACVIGLLAGFVYVKAYDMYISKVRTLQMELVH